MKGKTGRKSFSKEFKKEVVFWVTKEGRKPSEVAREFDVHRTTIDRWVREYSSAGDDAFRGNGNLPESEKEIRRLKGELAAAEADREILKKALAFFSRHSK